MSNKRLRVGFSLLELLAVVAILGIIAAIVLPRITNSSENAKLKLCKHHQGQLNTLLERYHLQNGTAATSISDIEGPTQELLPGTAPTCPISGAAYEVDATTGRVKAHTPGNHSP